MIRAFGRFFGIRYLDSAEIMDIARRHCTLMGWPWRQPVFVSEGLLSTSIHTNAEQKGLNVYLRICARTGGVEYAWLAKR